MTTKLLAVVALVSAFVCLWAVEPSSFTARVVGVTNGATVSIWNGRGSERLRLFGIDTPEAGHPLSTAARDFLSELLLDQSVTVEPRGRDASGLRIAVLTLKSGHVVNDEIVRAGLAKCSRKGAETEHWLERAEADARRKGRGVWANGGD